MLKSEPIKNLSSYLNQYSYLLIFDIISLILKNHFIFTNNINLNFHILFGNMFYYFIKFYSKNLIFTLQIIKYKIIIFNIKFCK